MSRPFENIRILDFSQVISGPYATELLALMGADVIKFERPGGDESRTFCVNPELLAKGMGSSYLSLNAGKRSVALDLKKPEAIEIILKLVKNADVLVENFRPGAMDRLGLGYEALKKIKPDLIYCSITGYGQEGPEADSAAYDGAVQAASGIMSITGSPEGGPMRVGFPFSDVATGSASALAIAGALFRRAGSGQGQYIDVAMIDASLSMMSPIIGYWLIGGVLPGQIGNMAWSRRPTSDMFKTKDDYLMLVINRDDHFLKFCKTIGRPDLPDDLRFADWPLRTRYRTELQAEITKALSAKSAADWESDMKEAGLAAARVNSLQDVLESPQMAHRNLLLELNGTVGLNKPITVLNTPFKYQNDPCGTSRPPPACGQHTDEILTELDSSEEQIEGMRKGQVIWELTKGK